MTVDSDDYDVFLDNWQPGHLLKYATLESNLRDPLAFQRLLHSNSDTDDVPRTAYASGVKTISDPEHTLKKLGFFKSKQADWAAEFRARVEDAGVDIARLDIFVESFAKDWVDGLSRRQNSPNIKGIKAAIHQHDIFYHGSSAGNFVLNPIDENATATFAPCEMKAIFDINANLLDTFIPDYLDSLDNGGATSINELYIRRGVYMPFVTETRQELHYLSSYSFALSLTEQFAQTWTLKTQNNGKPCIFSAPLPAVQKRVVAFAPFIQGMDLGQLELVVAPPIESTPLCYHGAYGDIHEYGFS